MPDLQMPVKAILAEIMIEFPSSRLLIKSDSQLMRIIDVLLRVITFGAMRTFLTDFVTTIGYTVYVPRSWVEDPDSLGLVITLRHERVHMRQRRKYGMILFSLLYMLLPLPGGLAYFRMRFEREAYVESLTAAAELSADPASALSRWRDRTVSFFVGPAYFFMWPFRRKVESWFDRVSSEVLEVELSRRALKTP